MDLPAFRRLLDAGGQAALAAAVELGPTEATFLSCHQRLRKQFPDDLVKAALETALLRRKAADKFSRADRMYFTREALEQSSGETVSRYRARRFAHYPHVGDLCCGIGGDLIGLSEVAGVTAVDADPLRRAMAAENIRAYQRSDRVTFVEGDVLTVPLPGLDAAFCDPDRRADGRRHLRLNEYAPAVDALRGRFPKDFPLGVKVAPGVPWDDLRPLDAEAEFVSVGGELKECGLWFGPLRTAGRRATVLGRDPGPAVASARLLPLPAPGRGPGGEVYASRGGTPDLSPPTPLPEAGRGEDTPGPDDPTRPLVATLFADQPADPEPPGPPLAYLYDPDPAVVRSGLVADLGRRLAARPVDPDIAYLTSDRHTPTPFARCYEIVEVMPFHARQLGERLRSMNVGVVTITKRGSAVDVDELRRKWKLAGRESRTVILTRVLGRPFALIAR